MIVKEFIKSLLNEENDFKFGKPWRYSKSSLTAILPIIRKTKEQRDYITLSEAKKFKIEDSGNIDTVLVENKEKKPIFVRAGEIFKGKTQERAAVISRVVMPGKTERIRVVCVHASRGISSGAKMKSAGYTPDSFTSAFVSNVSDSNLQRNTWRDVKSHSMRVSSTDIGSSTLPTSFGLTAYSDLGAGGGGGGSANIDDLQKNVKEYAKTVEDILRSVPKVDWQVGAALLSVDGCKALEVFDLADSWTAIREEVVRKEGEDISKEDKDSVFDYKPEKAKKAAQVPLKSKFSESDLYKDENTQTVKIDTEKYVGEVTVLKGKVIHLNVFKK